MKEEKVPIMIKKTVGIPGCCNHSGLESPEINSSMQPASPRLWPGSSQFSRLVYILRWCPYHLSPELQMAAKVSGWFATCFLCQILLFFSTDFLLFLRVNRAAWWHPAVLGELLDEGVILIIVKSEFADIFCDGRTPAKSAFDLTATRPKTIPK